MGFKECIVNKLKKDKEFCIKLMIAIENLAQLKYEELFYRYVSQ